MSAQRPCNSPYCECEPGKCSHPGCYDDRHYPPRQWVQQRAREQQERETGK